MDRHTLLSLNIQLNHYWSLNTQIYLRTFGQSQIKRMFYKQYLNSLLNVKRSQDE